MPPSYIPAGADVTPKEGDWTPERLAEVGERIWNMEREFNMKAGITAADDTLPKRLTTEKANTGPAEGKVSGLAEMLPEYYAQRGWSKDGKVTDETRQRLGL